MVSILGSEVKLLLSVMEPVLLHAVKLLSGDNTHVTLVLISRSSDKIKIGIELAESFEDSHLGLNAISAPVCWSPGWDGLTESPSL